MPNDLGPGEYNSAQLAINTLICEISDIELQRLKNSTAEQLSHKQSSNEISDIQERSRQEVKFVSNQIKDIDVDIREIDKEMRELDTSSDEYKQLKEEKDNLNAKKQDLKDEREELKDDRDAKIKHIESDSEAKEEEYGIQNTQLETQLDHLKATKEGLESMQDENIKGNH